MVISKKTIIFQGFRGVPIFSRGDPTCPRGKGGGVQMLISMETDINCDLPKRVRTPYPHLWIRA